MRTDELDYHLPEELIATAPVEPRDACRLMVVSRSDPARIEHRTFRDLPEFLHAGDLMVFNTSCVLPARLRGVRTDTGGRVEGLYVSSPALGRWAVLLRTKGSLRPGVAIRLHTADNSASRYELRLLAPSGGGEWAAAVIDLAVGQGITEPDATVLAAVGATPLPPYILQARKHRGEVESERDRLDREWYQTVYADRRRAGSVAAQTAGLHFTPALLDRLSGMGVVRADVVLHVGLGTFKPVAVENLAEHQMHAEPIDVSGAAVAALRTARAQGRRVICVGTTSVRTLESLPHPLTEDLERSGFAGETRLFITPGHRYRLVDGLITNFHLPRSTLLAMVGALFDTGPARLLELYRLAVDQRYRFFSYGDAMLILP